MRRDPDKQVMEKAYARWAPVYDVLCGPVFVNGRRAAAGDWVESCTAVAERHDGCFEIITWTHGGEDSKPALEAQQQAA